jgi:hypothetical protein
MMAGAIKTFLHLLHRMMNPCYNRDGHIKAYSSSCKVSHLTLIKSVTQFSDKLSDLQYHKIHSVVLSLLHMCYERWIEQEAMLTY